MMKPRYILFALALLACGTAPPATPAKAPPAEKVPPPAEVSEQEWTLRTDEKPKLLRGTLDRVARLVPVQSKEQPRGVYLLQLQGSVGDLEGLVLLATKVIDRIDHFTNGVAYRVSLAGEPRKILLAAPDGTWGLWSYERADAVKVEEGASVDGAALLALHYQQLSTGALAKESPAGREGRIAQQTLMFDKRIAALTKACAIPAKIDWASVKDQWFDEMSISSVCYHRLKIVKDFCESHPHLLEELKQLGSLQCQIKGPPGDVIGGVSKGKAGLVIVPGERRSDDPRYREAYRIYPELQTLFGEDTEVVKRGDRYIVLRKEGSKVAVYGGSKKELTRQRISGSNWDAGRNDLRLWAGGIEANLTKKAGKWSIRCGDSVKPYETVVGAERKRLLESASLSGESIWKREPYYLGRDSRGIYYYVDKMRAELGGKRHRVFVGRRGQAKLSKLVGLVEDSQGMLFSTKQGNLRLLIDHRGLSVEASWIHGNKTSKLISVPVEKNQKLIYQSLGAYFGEPLGDVCGN